MAGHFRVARRVVVASTALLVLLAAPAVAGLEREADTELEVAPPPDGDRVQVVVTRVGGEHRVVVVAGAAGSSSSVSDCRAVVMPGPDAMDLLADDDEAEAGSVAVRVICGDSAVVDEYWVPPTEVVDVDGGVRNEALRYVEEVLVPELELGTSPPSNILVGLATWFWLEGWDGEPIMVTVTPPFGEPVDVELAFIGAEWDFGDGEPPEPGDLGLAHPLESTVQHVYTDRSTSRDDPLGAYEVVVELQIEASYWFEGEGPFSVEPLTPTVQAPVVVRQLQAVLSPPR